MPCAVKHSGGDPQNGKRDALSEALRPHVYFHKRDIWPIIEIYLAIGPRSLLRAIDALMTAELEHNQRTSREVARSDAEVHSAQALRLTLHSDRNENPDSHTPSARGRS
jgi:hypothetical protein